MRRLISALTIGAIALSTPPESLFRLDFEPGVAAAQDRRGDARQPSRERGELNLKRARGQDEDQPTRRKPPKRQKANDNRGAKNDPPRQARRNDQDRPSARRRNDDDRRPPPRRGARRDQTPKSLQNGKFDPTTGARQGSWNAPRPPNRQQDKYDPTRQAQGGRDRPPRRDGDGRRGNDGKYDRDRDRRGDRGDHRGGRRGDYRGDDRNRHDRDHWRDRDRYAYRGHYTAHNRPYGWRPPHWRRAGWRPTYYRPPYYRHRHSYWGDYYWSPSWGWYFFAPLAAATLVYVATLPDDRECQPVNSDGERLYVCDGVLYRATSYRERQVYEIVTDEDVRPDYGDGYSGGGSVVGLRLASPYMRGPGVSSLQRELRELGYYRGGVDGVFGPGTERSLRAFQRASRLTDTGVVDDETARLLGL